MQAYVKIGIAAALALCCQAAAWGQALPENINDTQSILAGDSKTTADAGTLVQGDGILLVGGTLENQTSLTVNPQGSVYFHPGASYFGAGTITINGTSQTGDPYLDNAFTDTNRGVMFLVGDVGGDPSAVDPTPGTADLLGNTKLDKGGAIRVSGAYSQDLSLHADTAGGYVDVIGDATFSGAVDLGAAQLLSGGDAASAAANIRFDDALTADKVWAKARTMNFAGKVTAGQMLEVGADQTHGLTGSNIRFGDEIETGFLSVTGGNGIHEFDGDINITAGGFMGVDPGVRGYGATDQNNYGMIVLGGDNRFGGQITTSDQNALFLGSDSGIAVGLDAGTANIDIGYDSGIVNDNSAFLLFYSRNGQLAPSDVNAATRVTLRADANLTAANVNIGQNATLSLAGDASITGVTSFSNGSVLDLGLNTLTVDGDVDFKVGSTYSATLGADKSSFLSVSGNASIANGAILTVGGLTPEEVGATVILETGGNITGTFQNPLYSVKTSEDGKIMTVDGMRSGGDIVNDFVQSGDPDLSSAMQLFDRVVADTSVSADVRKQLTGTLERAAILGQTDGKRGRIALEQLGGTYASHAIEPMRLATRRFQSAISDHLVHLRDNQIIDMEAVYSGEAYPSVAPSYGVEYPVEGPGNRVWVGGLGSWGKQKDRNGGHGYEYDDYGAVVGYDWENGPVTLGVAAAYTRGELKHNSGYTTTDVDVANVGLYAAYNPDLGFQVEAGAGYGYSWNKMKTNLVLGGVKKGDYHNSSYNAQAGLGYSFLVGDDFRLIPSIGVRYNHLRQDGWNETVSDPTMPANWFDAGSGDYAEMPLTVAVNRTLRMGEFGAFTPEVRAAWIREIKDSRPNIRMGYVGSSDYALLRGVDAGRNRGLVGGGFKAVFNPSVDMFVDYNLEFRSHFRNHNLQAGFGAHF